MKQKKKITKRIAVNNPDVAVQLLAEFQRESNASGYMYPRNIRGKRVPFYTTAQIVAYYASQGIQVHGGWLGRQLHAALRNATNKNLRMKQILVDSSQVNVYSL